MNQETELAILFADVVGSTQLYEVLGDARAREMVGVCVEIMRGATEQHDGTVIKTMGDEVMATFTTANDAIDAASDMQRAIARHPLLQNETKHVAIRIGCHYGPVVHESRDVFGGAVHTANRMTSQAKAGQIITTLTMVEQLSPAWREAVRQIDVATLKGRTHEVALYEVLWQTEDITSMLPAICFCIWAAAFNALSAVGKVDITSSPMVLMTMPSCWSVAARITSMQIATISRARRSPSCS